MYLFENKKYIRKKTRSDTTKKENILLFVCSEAVELRLLKLETSHAKILPPTVSVFWSEF